MQSLESAQPSKGDSARNRDLPRGRRSLNRECWSRSIGSKLPELQNPTRAFGQKALKPERHGWSAHSEKKGRPSNSTRRDGSGQIMCRKGEIDPGSGH